MEEEEDVTSLFKGKKETRSIHSASPRAFFLSFFSNSKSRCVVIYTPQVYDVCA